MQRLLIFIGSLIALCSVFWPWVSSLPIGRPGLKLYIPLMTMLIVSSLMVSALLWLLRHL